MNAGLADLHCSRCRQSKQIVVKGFPVLPCVSKPAEEASFEPTDRMFRRKQIVPSFAGSMVARAAFGSMTGAV
jgi:hypothetical protein